MSKVCVICGVDVATRKRVKDDKGRYYCTPCYEEGVRRKNAAQNPAATRAGAAVAPPPPAAAPAVVDEYDLKDPAPPRQHRVPVAAPLADVAAPPDPRTAPTDEYDLKEPVAHAKKAVPQAACGVCKKVLPETSVKFIDGEFVCAACLSARGKNVPEYASNRPSARPSAEEEDASALGPVRAFMSTLPGIFVTAAVTLMVAWIGLSGVLYALFKADLDSPLQAILPGFLLTGLCVVLAGLLILSMFLVDRMLGGVGFGTVSDVIWQAMLLTVLNQMLGLVAEKSEAIAMLNFALQPMLWLVGFVVVFRIDFFEAMILSAVNWILGYVIILALMGFMLSSVRHLGGGAPPAGAPHFVAPGGGAAPADNGGE